MYRPLRALPLGAAASLLALSCSSSGTSPAPVTSPPLTRSSLTPSATANGAAMSLGVVTASRSTKGLPHMVRAVKQVAPPSRMSPENAARFHVERLNPLWFKAGAGADLELLGVHPLRGGGSVVRFLQRIDGVEIHNGELRVLIAKDGALKTVSGTRYALTAPSAFELDAPKALASVLGGTYKVAVAAPAIKATRQHGDYQSLTVPPRTDLMVEDARAKRVLFDVDGRLQAAWFLEMFSQRSLTERPAATRFIVAADDGRTLVEQSLTSHEAHEYRVFADPAGDKRPLDGPVGDFTPHPTGLPDGTQPPFVPPSLVSIDGFNVHGDPWIDTATTVTTGNNVDAFTDRNGDNQPTAPDFRAEKTGPLAFDYTYDPSRDALDGDTQAKAATVHLFYTINWLHDWWYDVGFTEVAGNAQQSNYGRGGAENDRMQANAQDQAVISTDPDCQGQPCRGNANMSTPADGLAPRMQMYLFTNTAAAATVTPGIGAISVGHAAWGADDFDLTAELVLVDDGSTDPGTGTVGTITDGCQPPVNNVTGKVVLVDRGQCNFTAKALNVQNAGGVGVVIANNAAGTVGFGPGGADPAVTIPGVGASQTDGNRIKTALGQGALTVHLTGFSDPELSGDLDTGVVAHEWGHYLHRRLSECSIKQCDAMSEGWGDFIGLHLLVRGTDNLDGAYAAGALWSLREDPNEAYFGIRRYPYSVDRAKNPLTFGHIADSAVIPPEVPASFIAPANSAIHQSGEVWATMLWESYRALIAAHGYDVARVRMGEYVVAGLLLTPPEATFTDVRDALIAAIAESDAGDALIVAQAFARRGAGSCAVSPPPDSEDFEGVVESFEVGANIVAGPALFSDDGLSCDDDGRLDRGETATFRFEIANTGIVPATNVQVSASTETPGIVIQSATLGTVGAGATMEVVLQVTATEEMPLDALAQFEIEAGSADGCPPSVQTVFARVGVDEDDAGTATETAEAFAPAWSKTGEFSELIWSREILEDGSAVIHGLNAGINTDTSFESPTLNVGTAPFTITLRHRHNFEAGLLVAGGPVVFFDGGVIEITTDDGATWNDISTYGATPAYGGSLVTVEEGSNNALAGRPAYVYNNPSLPEFDTETLDLGTALAGRNVRLRLRIGTDQASGFYGWDIDEIAFSGITNTPFTAVVADDSLCEAFSVNAGADQTVEGGATVTLAGAITGTPMSTAWTLVSGPPVVLTGANTATATFVAPTVTADTVLVFKLTASDGDEELSDEVQVTVTAPPTSTPDAGTPSPDAGTPSPDAGGGGDDGDDEGDDDGCGCSTSSPAAAGNLLLPLAAAVLALRRRRKRN